MSIDPLARVAATAFDALAPETRAALLVRTGSLSAARAEAFARLPEKDRIALVRSFGAVPFDCGPDVPLAPARGEVEVRPVHIDRYMGRKGLIRSDVFDRMRVQAAKRGGVSLNPEQVAIARQYRALVERREAGAVRCSSVEAMGGGGGGSADAFTDARLDASRLIDRLEGRVGPGVALVIRRVRPSARGPAGKPRVAIPDLAAVRFVCNADLDISAVLETYGWSVKGDTVRALTLALGAALDRMLGPLGPVRLRAVSQADAPAWWAAQKGA